MLNTEAETKRFGARAAIVRSSSLMIAGIFVFSCSLNTKGDLEGAASRGGASLDASQDPETETGSGADGGDGGQSGNAGADTADSADDAADAADAAGAAGDADDGAVDVAEDVPACDLGLVECSGVCVDTQNDGNHCGSCGNACSGANAVCKNGQCECVPNCISPNACDSDGCDGTCGGCEPMWSCWHGYCVKEWATSGAWNCHQKCGGNAAASPSLTCVGSDKGSCDDHETMCYCWCSEPGTCSL